MIFLDTSVIVAASYERHPQHSECLKRVKTAQRGRVACAAHTLAETFATLTRLPLAIKISPVQALRVVERVNSIFSIVTLDPTEYLDTITSIGQRGIIGAVVYDALILACARKVNANAIYTLNLKHFRLVAPDLSERILTL